MFKWLKKIMISIINAIKSLFVGDKEVQSVSIGDTVVYQGGSDLWPAVPSGERWRIASLSLQYSSGSKLDAAGNNYVELVATVYKYASGSSSSYETATIPCPLDPDYSLASWLSTSGTKVYGENRGTQDPSGAGAERTATIKAIRPTQAAYQVAGQASDTQFDQAWTITQAANTISSYPGAITNFQVEGFEEGDNIEVNESGIVFSYYEASGYRNRKYASGSSASPISISLSNSTIDVVAVTSGGQIGVGWITIDSQAGTITIEPYNASSGSRSAILRARDSSFTSVYEDITVTQTVSHYSLSFYNGSGVSKTIEADDQTFSIYVLPKYDGTLITSDQLDLLTVTVHGNSDIGNLQLSHKSVGSTYATLMFRCSENEDTYEKYGYITINFGDKSLRVTVTQREAANMPEAFVQAFHADNNQDIWIGTIKTGPSSNPVPKGIFIGRTTSFTSMQFSVTMDWSCNGSDYEEEGTTMTIDATHGYQHLGSAYGEDLYGAWLVSNEYGVGTVDDSVYPITIDRLWDFYVVSIVN